MTLFEQLGSITAIKQLAHTFYDVMGSDPDFIELRALHPTKLMTTKKKLFRLLTHWLGGPKRLTVEPPSACLLERRHRQFQLNEHHATLWLSCMDKTMTSLELEPALKEKLHRKFAGMIKAMQQQRASIENTHSKDEKKGH